MNSRMPKPIVNYRLNERRRFERPRKRRLDDGETGSDVTYHGDEELLLRTWEFIILKIGL